MSDNSPEPAALPATVKPRNRTALRRMLGLIPGLLVLLVSMRLLEAALPLQKQTTGLIVSLLCLVLGFTLCIVGPLASAPLANTPRGPKFHTPIEADRTQLDRLWRKLEWREVRNPYWVNAAPVSSHPLAEFTGVYYERGESPDQIRLNVVKLSSRSYYIASMVLSWLGAGGAMAAYIAQKYELILLASIGTVVGITILNVIYRANWKMRPWIVIDRTAQQLELPNARLSFPLAKVDRWQLIHCVPDDMSDSRLQLAVVVRGDDQQLTRHLITTIAPDQRSHVRRLVVDSEIPLDEIVLGGKNPLRRDKLHPHR